MPGHDHDHVRVAEDAPAGKRPPRFSMVGVVLSAILLYFVLTVFLLLLIWAKSIPVPLLAAHAGAGAAGAPPSPTIESSMKSFFNFTFHVPPAMRPLVTGLRWLTILSLLSILVVHSPIRIHLGRLRRGKTVPEPLLARSEKIALRSAWVTAGLGFMAAASHATGRLLTTLGGDVSIRQLVLRSVPFYVVVVLLATSFVYYWQNYRIKIIFSPFIFTRAGFVKSSPRRRRKTILSQLRISQVISTLLPLVLVILYFFAFVSSADLAAVSEPQKTILLGDFAPVYRMYAVHGMIPLGPEPVPYLGAVDTVLFIGGLGTAFVISLFLLILISKWSGMGLLVPLRELQRNVMLTAQGDFTHATPVRDTDEIGELTENFNSMIASLRESDALRIEKEAAVTANREKSAFLANMSHELRTPLNAILGFAQLVDRSGTLDPEQRENIGTITRSATQLLALINDILDMSKIEAGRVELNPSAFDLRGMLGDLESMFSLRAREKDLTLVFDLAPEMPRFVFSDEGKLRQVLVNLLGNALKFTERGGATLRVRSRDESSGDARLFFEVEDTGIGIAEKEIGSLFEPFVQSRNVTGMQEGTGLGLSICRKYVTLLRGAISARSQPGKGSVFSFDVRVGSANEAQVAPVRPRRRVTGLAPGQPVYRILIAEDRDSNRELLTKLLSPLGFDVRGVTNGAECVSMWETWEPHLVWMDMRMPVMDGYEATRRIKASVRGQATVIIALTASAFDSDRKLILSEGCDDFVRKPFVEEEIYEKLEKHLGVTFLQETDSRDGAAPDAAAPPLTPALLAPIAQEWREAFRKATVEADYTRLQQLLDELRPQYPEVRTALGSLVSAFEYEKILAALEQSP
jgi:signal transduction histidine kinase/CheY-like chemotaxis protein